MRVGIIELISDTVSGSWTARLHNEFFKKQLVSITPQAVAVWCRQLGHRVFYRTFYGQEDPKALLPNDLDVVFIATHTPSSALAYALAKLFRKEGTLTVIGGPHAMCFPQDCLRFFDVVVGHCDKALIDDILRGHIDPPCRVSSGRLLREIPTVEERMPEIVASSFYRGRPKFTTVVSLLSSLGCPYRCNFCVDWKNQYTPLAGDRLAADLNYLSLNWPGVLVGFQDPNFGVRFDETMDIIETTPEGRRNRYIMESSLSNLKKSRLQRLRRTNCVYLATGIESWSDYSNKAGAGSSMGRNKLEQVIRHIRLIQQFVSGVQVNFLLGTDADEGNEPVELTKEFIRRLPSVWPAVNIPTPMGGTPFYDASLAQDRISRSLPFAFYYSPYIAATPTRYNLVEYYDHLIDIYGVICSSSMMARRLITRTSPVIRLIHTLRRIPVRHELAEYRQIRELLVGDPQFRAFHQGRSKRLPEFYHSRFEQRLGRYAELLARRERIPRHEQIQQDATGILDTRSANPGLALGAAGKSR